MNENFLSNEMIMIIKLDIIIKMSNTQVIKTSENLNNS